ncbi:SCO3374 family protein [Streptomyces sp. NPDC002454]
MTPAVPRPRRPLGPPGRPSTGRGGDGGVRHWYENVLGWPAVPAGRPGARGAGGTTGVLLVAGVRFDVLEVPAAVGRAVLAGPERTGPVTRCGDRVRFLVAAGAAEEVPGLLAWLEWGGLAGDLGLAVIGSGGAIEAPWPPVPAPSPVGTDGAGPGADPAGAAVWVRPPEPGRGAETGLPAPRPLAARSARGSAPRDGGGAPDLVRLVDRLATECLRVRLGRARDQRWASSYA